MSLVGRVRSVAIADCVHYDGFRYGRNEFNPYENYIQGLSQGVSTEELRADFIDFLIHYRPRTLGDILGIQTRRPVPLWLLPWKSWRKLYRPGGWLSSPEDISDILTYFSEAGIPWALIEKEYGWLEGAWSSISRYGYQPEQYSYINVFELRGNTESRFLVLDGNHRLSALSALGHHTVVVQQARWCIARRSCARYWPLVLSGHILIEDALALFDAYFRGRSAPPRTPVAANILMDK